MTALAEFIERTRPPMALVVWLERAVERPGFSFDGNRFGPVTADDEQLLKGLGCDVDLIATFDPQTMRYLTASDRWGEYPPRPPVRIDPKFTWHAAPASSGPFGHRAGYLIKPV
jgi:hypothetical protein